MPRGITNPQPVVASEPTKFPSASRRGHALTPSSSVASQRSTRRSRFKPVHRDQTSMASISPSPRRGHALAPPRDLSSKSAQVPLCSAPVRLVVGINLAVGIKLCSRDQASQSAPDRPRESSYSQMVDSSLFASLGLRVLHLCN
uniref:Uncharacterized protein n=1 Tax=Brassica campestris TaxID=3711 RepID=M4FIM3_BRACM